MEEKGIGERKYRVEGRWMVGGFVDEKWGKKGSAGRREGEVGKENDECKTNVNGERKGKRGRKKGGR